MATPIPATAPEVFLRDALGLGPNASPFPWQSRLLRDFLEGDLSVRALDIPTGLGKTAVMAIWLVARVLGAQAIPRRLVYVVDRRAVVDQATDVAERLRSWVDESTDVKEALGLGSRSLPISTLRGQHVDNREWLADPAAPAIVVGTVDMIGSRLLFEGYGVSRKMRPYHGGLLGADTLVALDEAHLVPPFERLLDAVADGGAVFGPRADLAGIVPGFRLLSLSATGRARGAGSFTLDKADLGHPVVSRRLVARKRLRMETFEGDLAPALAQRAWVAAGKGVDAVRCIVFCDRRSDALAVVAELDRLSKGDKKSGQRKIDIERELFVGGRRVFERERTMQRLRELGFIAGSSVAVTKPSFVVATSAGEVGVDLDADHMVSDLVAWERMVQRLGRVNRRGEGDATVTVLLAPEKDPPKTIAEAYKRREADAYPNEGKRKKDAAAIAEYEADQSETAAWPKPLKALPKLEGGGHDASPGALREIKLRAAEDPKLARVLDAATTRPPLRPALTRALLDAWSMTSLAEHTGRPLIAPWLRGWIKDEEPQTAVVWRRWLPVRDRAVPRDEAAVFFECAAPHMSELLETETRRVVEWLLQRAIALGRPERVEPEEDAQNSSEGDPVLAEPRLPVSRLDPVAFVLDPACEFVRWMTLQELVELASAEKWRRDRLARELYGMTLVVDRRIAGLADGMLSEDATDLPETADGDRWIEPESGEPPVVRFRIRERNEGMPEDDAQDGWRERFRFVLRANAEGEAQRWLVVEKWRHDAAIEEDRSAGRPQGLDEHEAWTERHARAIATRIGLPSEYAEVLALAARLHDEGKRAERWQRAASAPRDGRPFAKTLGPFLWRVLDGYRHEFGSLPVAEKDPLLRSLTPPLRDLALHLIAAHHGFARPVIPVEGCDDAPPSVLGERARDVALRFVRLQKTWGPWGLAWWESLLRAADQSASRENDEPREKKGER